MTWPVWCPTCLKPTRHASNGTELVCEECSLARPDDVPLLVSQVQDMRFCDYCRTTLPADHNCPAGAVGPQPDIDTP
ncbi:hypothetical protein [Nonomuraea guangzhouensis]|uniref:Uncharacterized protein n=1 Tax=Nonomuraea guangzhouensis TaxID=1291555 RepID=A0ABW4GWZ9_9ACTN|nr:hypothetical protein [Nonomuraea guangzhouensis]